MKKILLLVTALALQAAQGPSQKEITLKYYGAARFDQNLEVGLALFPIAEKYIAQDKRAAFEKQFRQTFNYPTGELKPVAQKIEASKPEITAAIEKATSKEGALAALNLIAKETGKAVVDGLKAKYRNEITSADIQKALEPMLS